MRALTQYLRDLWHARELLRQLVSKELKVRYKHSALGFLWSLLTPVLMTVVFTIVFSTIIRINVDNFASFFLAGYLVWSYFQNSVQGSIQAITGNGSLIRKVYFPREVLPLSNVFAQGFHFVLALIAVSPFLVWQRGPGVITYLPAVVVGIVLITMFASGLAMLVAALNVTFRDLQEFIVVIFLAWFYATPIIYPLDLVAVQATSSTLNRVAYQIISANPMTWFVRLFREPLYGVGRLNEAGATGASLPPSLPSLDVVVASGAIASVTFVLGYILFHNFAVTFAKEV